MQIQKAQTFYFLLKLSRLLRTISRVFVLMPLFSLFIPLCPGKTVARDSNYDGRWQLMDENFRDELKALILSLLKEENLTTKKINGIEVNGQQANEYFQQFIAAFQTNSSVQPQSIYTATVDKFLTTLLLKSFQVYKNYVKNSVDHIKNESDITNVFNASKNAALVAYDGERKMGNAENIRKFRNDLDAKIKNDSLEWKAISTSKIIKIREDQRRAEEAERLRSQREQQEKIAKERTEQIANEKAARAAEAIRNAEILRQQQLAIQAEQERQRIAEEERQRLAEERRQKEIEEQEMLEADRILQNSAFFRKFFPNGLPRQK